MRKSFRALLGVGLALIVTGLVFANVLGQTQTPTFQIPEGLPVLKAPILFTSCGLAPGALEAQLLMTLLTPPIASDLGDPEEGTPITADELAAKYANGTVYGVLFVTTGTSLKGMGAAGVDVDSEVARCTALIAKAKELGIFVIVGQIEGPSRRVDETDEASIKGMSPLADLLITRSDVNEDGYFTTLAEEKKIPQIFISTQLDLQVLMPLLFEAK